jgi:hypothetical protein
MTYPTQKINASELKPGMHLCYRVREIVDIGSRVLFLRNEQLVGEIVLVTPMIGGVLFVTLGYGRPLMIGKDEEREIEIGHCEPMVSHRGKATTFAGISID